MKWLVILAMLGTALAEDTNRFSFTNKAGQVFTDAKLIKVENGEAVVIAGTTGARVKIEELPLEVQTLVEFRESEEAAKLRGVHTTTDSKKGTREDYVVFRGHAEEARVFSTFERQLFAGESSFKVNFIVHLKGPERFDGKFELWFANGSVRCSGDPATAESSKPEKAEEGFPWEFFFSATISKDEMVRLISAGAVGLVFDSSEGRRRVKLEPPEGLEGFKELCLGSKERRVVEAAGPSTPGVSIGTTTMRVTESNQNWWKYAYRVQVSNATADRVVKTIRIEFLDAAGFMVADRMEYGVALPPGEATMVTGYTLIIVPGAKDVKTIQARFARW